MRFLRHAAAAGLGVCAAALIACGNSNGLLAGDDASRLNDQLDAVSVAVDSRRCLEAQRAAGKLRSSAADLPRTVASDLRRSLERGAETLAQQARADCRPATTTETTETEPEPETTETETQTTQSTPTDTTPTDTAPTDATPTATTPTDTTPTSTTPTTTTPTTTTAPDDDSGSGGGASPDDSGGAGG